MISNKHPRDDNSTDSSDEEVQSRIKKLRIDRNQHVAVPCEQRYGGGLPSFLGEDAQQDINYAEANLVLKELAYMREFRMRIKSKYQTHVLQEVNEEDVNME